MSSNLIRNIAWLMEHDLGQQFAATVAGTKEIETRMSTTLDALIAQADANEQQEETVIVGLRADKATLQAQLDASQAALTTLQAAGAPPEQIAAVKAIVDRETAFLAAAQAAPAPAGSVPVVDTTGAAVTTTTAAAPGGGAATTGTGGDTTGATGGDTSGAVPAGAPSGGATTQPVSG